jgi:ankyrin repeat protein
MPQRFVGVGLLAATTALLSGTVQHAQQPAASAETRGKQGGDGLDSRVDFARDVQPILRQQCYSCHGPDKQKNGLRLDRRKDAMRGGTIAVIGPGNADGSRLYQRLVGSEFGTQMPPTGALPPSQIEVLKQWIDQGAEWPDALSGDHPPTPPNPAAADLMEAIRAADRTRITAALSNGDACKQRGPGGATPLMYAALYGDAALVKRVLDGGGDPNAADDGSATALMWAIPDVEKVKLLVDRGAGVSARSADGRTPLMIAAGLPGSAPVVRLLIERGAKVTERGPSLFGDVSPLILAAYNGDEASFRLLVEKGADLESDGVAALAFSLRAQCTACVDMILPKLPVPALNVAMAIGAPPNGPALAMPLFLARGADPNARGAHGLTMLMLAAASDAVPVDAVRMLIERGADVNAKGPGGATALQLARLRGNTPVTDLLEKAGATAEAPAPVPALMFDPAGSPRAAVSRAIPLLQRSDVQFMAKSGCVSCHNNSLTAMTVSAARRHGIAVDDEVARTQAKAIGAYLHSWRDRAIQGIGIPGDADTISYVLLGLAAENYPADPGTDAMARFLKGQQRADGHWDLLAHRPPIESTPVQVTAMSMRALQVYAPAALRVEYEPAIRRAAEWIARAEARTTEEHAFKLLGLHWSRRPAQVRTAAAALIAEQRGDGGWSQLPTIASDAYATGQALYALAESGAVRVTHPAYQAGVRFLLKTQLADGSWFVKSRAVALQPHFEAGFPHGRDQFISAAATNWAALALARVK